MRGQIVDKGVTGDSWKRFVVLLEERKKKSSYKRGEGSRTYIDLSGRPSGNSTESGKTPRAR